MRSWLAPFFALLCFLPVAAAAQSAEERYDKARTLFDRLVYLEQHFDAGMKDLYADNAVITIVELRADREWVTTMKGAEFKHLIETYMPTAAVVGEIYNYSNVAVSPILGSHQMRVLATRTSRLKGDSFPYELVVGSGGPGGQWLIYEETSKVRP